MKLRYLLGITLAVGLCGGCSSDYMNFKGGNFVQFSSSLDEVIPLLTFQVIKKSTR